jgi:hypothetical protein
MSEVRKEREATVPLGGILSLFRFAVAAGLPAVASNAPAIAIATATRISLMAPR